MISSVLLMSCRHVPEDNREQPLVIATLFPHYDIVKHLAGEWLDVELLLPPGADYHSFEPSSRTMVRMKSADLIVFTGIDIEPWITTLIEEGVPTLDLSKNIPLMEADHHHHHTWYQDVWYWFIGLFGLSHDHHHIDPHYWLDPLNAMIMVNDIAEVLVTILPERDVEINENRDRYLSELDSLHEAFLDLVDHAEVMTVMHGGHNAFSYFAARYGIDYYTPYRGFSSDAEPTPQALSEMINRMNELNIEHLFSEMLISPHVAQAITENTNATILYLYAAESIPIDDYERGFSFIDMLKHNLAQFKIGMRYNP